MNKNEVRQLDLGSPNRFGFEWAYYSSVLPESRLQLQRWLGSITLESFKDQSVLDVGCGMGRNSYWVLKEGASQLLAIDVDDGSLTSARKNLSEFSNAQVQKISAYDLDSKNIGTFDRVFSIGVVHHLANPAAAVQAMWGCVKPGGMLILWCYGKSGNNWTLPVIEAFRFLGRRLPIRLSHTLAKVIAFFSWPLFKYFPWKTEYYRNLKSLSFSNFQSIVFDQILPQIAHYWTKEEILSLVAPLGGNAEIEFVQGNSWSVRVRK